MSTIKNVATAINTNKDAISQKAVIAVGALAGLLITSSLVDRLGDRRPKEVVLLDADSLETSDLDPEI